MFQTITDKRAQQITRIAGDVLAPEMVNEKPAAAPKPRKGIAGLLSKPMSGLKSAIKDVKQSMKETVDKIKVDSQKKNYRTGLEALEDIFDYFEEKRKIPLEEMIERDEDGNVKYEKEELKIPAIIKPLDPACISNFIGPIPEILIGFSKCDKEEFKKNGDGMRKIMELDAFFCESA